MARDALTDYIARGGQGAGARCGKLPNWERASQPPDSEEALAASGALTPDERADLEWAADQGQRAKDRLLKAHLRLVAGIAERYAGRGVPFLDLIQAGSLGLSRAAEKFDDTKGYKFSTYATWWIHQAITRAVAGKAPNRRIPVHTATAIAEIAVVQRGYFRELGREPTPEELAAQLGTGPG